MRTDVTENDLFTIRPVQAGQVLLSDARGRRAVIVSKTVWGALQKLAGLHGFLSASLDDLDPDQSRKLAGALREAALVARKKTTPPHSLFHGDEAQRQLDEVVKLAGRGDGLRARTY